jgi:acetyl-CoA carboxylase biotin carboxyl carrier protein
MKFEEIKELIELLNEKDIGKIKVKNKDFEIVIEKENKTIKAPREEHQIAEPQAVVTAPEPAPAKAPASTPAENSTGGVEITSPMVGTFYIAPSPDSPPFVKIGDRVRKGDTLCILEAMKIMNELEAEFDCKILDILVKDGEPVEYDKPLFRVEKL